MKFRRNYEYFYQNFSPPPEKLQRTPTGVASRPQLEKHWSLPISQYALDAEFVNRVLGCCIKITTRNIATLFDGFTAKNQ